MRSPLFISISLVVAMATGFLVSRFSFGQLIWATTALVIFTIAFINMEWALYILIFSMLLSPEMMVGDTGRTSLERGITLRFEDFLLVVIGLSWFAKNAINKELGLFLKTPLNKAILFYALACVVSTGFGMMAGRVEGRTGFFFVLKYIEYFIVFFMMVNHVRSTDQIKRFVFCLLLTAFIAAVIGILQIPGGGRVSAPFEGEHGEPNTFGGYLLFIGAVATGLAVRTDSRKIKQVLVVLIAVMLVPFLFTQSRSSYLALIPACLVLGVLADRRIIILGLLMVAFIVSPLFLPASVRNRIEYTFNQPETHGQIKIGDLHLDTSTSARLVSWKQALQDWPQHPLIGYGVTGYHFIDAQFPRVLVETGVLGLMAFFYLLYSIFKLAIENINKVQTPEFKGLAIGFLAGLVGLVFHAVGANTFIIVRIMEPFWFFVGIVAVLPQLERRGAAEPLGGVLPSGKLRSTATNEMRP